MQVKLFTIPIIGGEAEMEVMNAFLRGHKVLKLEKELVQQPQGVYWCFCITYLLGVKPPSEGKKKVDYKYILDEESFARFSKLRELRKKVAKDEGVPAFAIFSDKELAGLARLPGLTFQSMKSVPGIGEKKIEKFGKYFVTHPTDEKSQ